jgi:hypothetical protein
LTSIEISLDQNNTDLSSNLINIYADNITSMNNELYELKFELLICRNLRLLENIDEA